MIISQSGIVDIIPEYNRQLRPIFCVSEGDKNTRMINITVQQAGENFSIPTSATVYITGRKADNTIFSYRCSFSGYIVSFQIAEQMSAKDGIVLCELQIIDGGNPLGSANFVYWVEPSPVQNGDASESDLNVFLEAIVGAGKLDNFYANVEDMVATAVENIQIREGQTVIDASLSVEGAAADAKATGDIVRAFMDALVTETTEEAAIATCDDAAGGLPLKKLTANIVPTQAGSGDPSPDNVRAISGYSAVNVYRTRKNLLDPSTASALGNTVWFCEPNGFLFKGGVSYTFSVSDINDIDSIAIYATDKSTRLAYSTGSTRQSITYTPTEDTYGLPRLYSTTAITQAIVDGTMIEVGNSRTAYEPYNGATYPVTFPTEAGTVYGGTLTVNSDGSGALTVDTVGWTFDGTETPTNIGTLTNYYRARYNTANLAGTSIADGVTKYSHGIVDSTYAGDFAHAYGTPSYVYVFVPIVEGLSVKQYMAAQAAANTPVQVTYKLATPTTYALSAVQVAQMLNGVNNIWTDAAGTLTTEYYASTGLYVEKKVNAQRNMIAGVEEAMVATQNYSVGDLLIVGNTLYKVTAAVSSGAALVVGTNVTETTVAEQLLALA